MMPARLFSLKTNESFHIGVMLILGVNGPLLCIHDSINIVINICDIWDIFTTVRAHSQRAKANVQKIKEPVKAIKEKMSKKIFDFLFAFARLKQT